jgi:hypothetical protein
MHACIMHIRGQTANEVLITQLSLTGIGISTANWAPINL